MYSDRNGYDAGRGNGSDFVFGLICGVAAGAAIGLLFAPKAGAELRNDLAGSADRLRQRASETYDQASSAVNDFVAKGRRAAQQGKSAVDQASSAFEGAMDQGKEALRRGREKFNETRSDFADDAV